MSIKLTGTSADHRCLLPFEDPMNSSFTLSSDILNMSIPRGDFGWSQCERLDANFTEEYFETGVPAINTVPCEHWVFDTSQYQSSAVYEVWQNIFELSEFMK